MMGTEAGFRELFASVSNWGRWGSDDVRGALNTIDAGSVQRAVGAVGAGRTISCSRPLGLRRRTLPTDNLVHPMTKTGADAPASGEGTATDWLGVGLHGLSFTHLDAHSHVFWDGQMYNGRAKDRVTAERGALAGGLEPFFDGVLTRGIRVDGPALLGIDVLPDGYGLSPDELAQWFDRVEIRPEPGDALFVRTGFGESGPLPIDAIPKAGISPRCMPLLRDVDISVLVADGIHDPDPSEFDSVRAPVHVLGLAAMGLWLIDNADLAEGARACGARQRYDFLTSLAPVPIRRAPGSLVNPVVVL